MMFSTMVLFLFHCDSLGFAAARMDVRAFNWQMIPALAMLNVCCSITSWRTLRVESFILSNSSIQHMPLSASTNAPVCRTSCLVSGSFVTYAVSPTAEEPLPDVYWLRGTKLYTYDSNWDLLVPGSPHSKMLISALKFPRPEDVNDFLVPPKSCRRIPFLMSSFS